MPVRTQVFLFLLFLFLSFSRPPTRTQNKMEADTMIITVPFGPPRWAQCALAPQPDAECDEKSCQRRQLQAVRHAFGLAEQE